MEELIYHYKAFISHTEKDSVWAEKLHTKLNHYSIPSKIKKKYPNLPKNLRPVFWYKRDISELHLKKTIRKELYNSEYLIVVCSPDSARSEWVNEEVKIFKEEFGRGDRVIPFIVDGTANSKVATDECFPELLRNLPKDDQIRGIDVRGEDGSEGAIINVIASMLHVRYDELYQRYVREKRRKLFVGILAFVVSCIISFFVWDYNFNTKYEYYLDYADCNGIPTGICPIEKEDAKKAYRTYRFESIRNLLRRVVYVDNKGNAQPVDFTEYIDRFSIQELLYENEKYVGVECKSYEGDVICKYKYSTNYNVVNISDNQDDLSTSIIRSASSITNGGEVAATQHFLDNILTSPSKIGRYEYERDSLGYISTIYYCKHPLESQRTTDVNGIAGIKYVRDSLHRVVSLEYIDLQGKPKSNEYGIVYKRYTYDEYGYLSVSEYLNGDGELQCNELGWAKSHVEYDKNGYPQKQTYYGDDGNYCSSIYGETITKFEWDKTSMRMSYYDDKENPILLTGTANVLGGHHAMLEKRDSNGDIVQVEFYGLDNELCYNGLHCAIVKIKYNKRRPCDISYWSPEDEPCYNCYYVHRVRQEYLNGNVISYSCWGPDNTKIICPTGFHLMRYEYDHDRVTNIKTYNILDQLAPSLVLTNAVEVEIEYENSYPSVVTFKDVNGKPCVDEHRDKNNTMIPFRDWAICKIKNENGMNTEYSYYDCDGEKMLCEGMEPFFRKKLEYNEVGAIVKTSLYDVDDNLISKELGNCIMETQYDIQNPRMPVSIVYRNNEGELSNNIYGIARIENTYYPNGKPKSVSYFNAQNEATYMNNGHQYRYEYDNKNRLKKITCLNDKGLPAIEAQNHCYKMESDYDNFNRPIEIRRYDASNRLLNRPFPAIIRMYYERDHQVVKYEYLDNNYNLCNNPDMGNVATVLMDYDGLGRRIHEKYFDENNKAVVNAQLGYAECLIQCNNTNSRILCFKDENGDMINVQGRCRMMDIYSETSLPLLHREDCINSEGELELVTRYMYEYDAWGSMISSYSQNNDISIEKNSPDTSQTIYFYEDEYADILKKIEFTEDSVVNLYFDNIDL